MKNNIFNDKVFMHCFGCKVNQYEAQALREKYLRDGCVFTEDLEDADVLLIQSCTVTAEAGRQCRQLIRKALRMNPALRIYISGCYSAHAGSELVAMSPAVKILDVKELQSAVRSGISSFEDHSRAFVKIQDGCDAFCSYCIVPYVRNRMISRPEAEILTEIAKLAGKGYPEIVLTGVHLGKYAPGLKNIIEKILKLKGEFRLRLSSLEPGEVSEDLLRLMKDNPVRVCRHFHLPMQSGSDRILKKMKRPYTAEEFRRIIGSIRGVLPDAGISTDIIVGFPGETDADFKDTYILAKSLKLSRLHVFRYSKRDGTFAAGLKETVPLEKIKARAVALRELDIELQSAFWKSFVGDIRHAVLEGGKNTLLTDNYIRLGTDVKNASFYSNIARIKIINNNGRAWAVPV